MSALELRLWLSLSVQAALLSACHVQETQVRCERSDDCDDGQECYVGYCVPTQSPDASQGQKRSDATGEAGDSARLRRRSTPTLTGLTSLDAAQGKAGDDADGGPAQSDPPSDVCVDSDEDAGSSELPDDACCDRDVPCYGGPEQTQGVGRCRAGVRRCEDGVLGPCRGSVVPRAEACDNAGEDDDCDGKQDNIPGLGESCTREGSAECSLGARVCVEGQRQPICQALALTTPEQCNKKDDDCDGKVDESFDLERDPGNCGACGNACASGQVCCNGACGERASGSADGCPQCGDDAACTGGTSCCDGACSDLMTDAAHCGACGQACGRGEACCGGVCTDVRGDVNNCGSCGAACSQGSMPACCGGACTDLATSERHCGQCGNSCGSLCSCVSSDGPPECRGVLGSLCF